MTETKQHWNKIYSTKAETELSWFQPYPKTSMAFLEAFPLPLTANIIDVGGGDSYFVDALLQKGYRNIWVLDISEAAIEKAKKRLGTEGDKVNWMVSDITDFVAPVQFDFWHDRATFHFLTSDEATSRYVGLAAAAIKPNGYLVLGTFSDKGPQKCSGLQIRQYFRGITVGPL